MQADDRELLRQRFEPRATGTLTPEGQLHAARFSPCGRFLFAGGYDGKIHRWQVGEGLPQPQPSLSGHHGWVQPLAFHATLPLLFSGDSWGELRAWSYAGEMPELKWNAPQAHDGWLRGLDVSPDGQWLVSCGSDRKVRICAAADGGQSRTLVDGDEDIFCVRFHPDGQSLFIGDGKGLVQQRQIASGEILHSFDASKLYLYQRLQDVGGVRCLAVDASGQRLAVGGTKPNGGGSVTGTPLVLVFDIADGRLLHELELGTTNDVFVLDAAWHRDGFLMMVTSGQPGAGKFLFQRAEDREPFYVTTKLQNCHSLGLHPDGRRLAVVSTNRGSNGNGRPLNKDGQYVGNHSPIDLFTLPESAS